MSITYLSVVLNILSSIFIVRAVGAGGRGIIAMATTASMYLTIALSVGMALSARRTAAHDSAEIPALRALFRRLGIWLTPISLVISLPLTYLVLPAGDWSERVATAAVFALTGMSVTALGYTQLLAAENRQKEFALARCVPSVVVAISAAALAVFGLLPVWAALACLCLRPVLEVAWAGRYLPPAARTSPSFRPHVRFGLSSLAGQFAEISAGRLDQVILLPLIGAVALGQYAVAVSFVTLPLAISQSAITHTFRHTVRRESMRPGDALRLMAKVVAVTAVPVALLVGVAPPVLPLVFGDEFMGLGAPIAVLGGATLLLAGSFCSTYTLAARGHPSVNTAAWIVGTAVTLVTLPWLAPMHGVLGASIASALSYGATFVVHIGGLVRVLSRPEEVAAA